MLSETCANVDSDARTRTQNERSTSPARSLVPVRSVRSTITIRPYPRAEHCRIRAAEKSSSLRRRQDKSTIPLFADGSALKERKRRRRSPGSNQRRNLRTPKIQRSKTRPAEQK